MKKLVILDLDGTLLDTIADLGNATNHALRTLGFPERKRDEYYRLVGRGITNLFKGAVPEGCDTPETIARMRELFLAHYGVHLCDRTHPYPGIVELCRTAAGATKDEVLYVGDSNVDMQTGLGAGVDTVGVTWGSVRGKNSPPSGPPRWWTRRRSWRN